MYRYQVILVSASPRGIINFTPKYARATEHGVTRLFDASKKKTSFISSSSTQIVARTRRVGDKKNPKPIERAGVSLERQTCPTARATPGRSSVIHCRFHSRIKSLTRGQRRETPGRRLARAHRRGMETARRRCMDDDGKNRRRRRRRRRPRRSIGLRRRT